MAIKVDHVIMTNEMVEYLTTSFIVMHEFASFTN